MAQTYDLTRGNPTKLILTFFFPMLFTNMLQQIYSIADTAIVGKGLGDDALAAVGNMSSLTFLVIGFSIGLTNGFSILTAQYYGAGNQKNLRRSVASAILLALGMTALLTIVSMLFLRQVLLLLQTPEKIMQDSLTYGYVIFGGLAASIAYNLCASILRALGDSKTPFYAIVVSTVLNIILDSLCVFVFKTGVGGPAAVTVLAQVVSESSEKRNPYGYYEFHYCSGMHDRPVFCKRYGRGVHLRILCMQQVYQSVYAAGMHCRVHHVCVYQSELRRKTIRQNPQRLEGMSVHCSRILYSAGILHGTVPKTACVPDAQRR